MSLPGAAKHSPAWGTPLQSEIHDVTWAFLFISWTINLYMRASHFYHAELIRVWKQPSIQASHTHSYIKHKHFIAATTSPWIRFPVRMATCCITCYWRRKWGQVPSGAYSVTQNSAKNAPKHITLTPKIQKFSPVGRGHPSPYPPLTYPYYNWIMQHVWSFAV